MTSIKLIALILAFAAGIEACEFNALLAILLNCGAIALMFVSEDSDTQP